MKRTSILLFALFVMMLVAGGDSSAWCPSGGTMRPLGPASPDGIQSQGPPAGVATGSSKGLWEGWWDNDKDKYLDYKKPFPKEVVVVSAEGSQAEGTEMMQLKALLEQALKDGDFNVRLGAAIAMGRSGNTEYVKKLREALSDPEREVSDSAILALGMLKDVDSIPLIGAKISNAKEHVVTRGWCCYSLGYMRSDKSIDFLKKAIEFRDGNDTPNAATIAIGLLKDPTLVPYLEGILIPKKGKIDSYQASYAALALGRIGGPEAVKVLMTAAEKMKDDYVLQSIMIGLALCGTPEAKDMLMTTAKKGKDTLSRSFAILAIGRLKIDGMYDFMVECANDKKSEDFKGFSILALGLYGDQKAVEILKKNVGDKKISDQLKSASMLALGFLKAKEATKELLDIAKSNKELESKRGYALYALGLIGDDSVAADILPLLDDGVKNPNIYRDCAYALAMLGKHKEVLTKLYKDYDAAGSGDVRTNVMLMLGKIGDKSTVTFIKNKFEKEASKTMRLFMVSALGYLGDSSKYSMVKELTADNNYQIKFLSIDHLRQIP